MNKHKYFIALFFFFTGFTLSNQTNHIQTIYLGSGCFWGAEKGYEALDGVINAKSGYANGYGVSPNYRSIIQLKNKFNKNNFAEVVEVTFNNNFISVEEILIHFFESHDPTQYNRQGNDIGTQYRSTILYSDDDQKEIAEMLKEKYQNLLSDYGYGSIKTIIEPLDNFYLAEEYHQDYLKKNPNGYCPDLSTGIVFNKEEIKPLDNTELTKGKHILVIASRNYCPYCEKLKSDVTNDYKGSIPMT